MYDLLFTNASVIDGTGKPAFRAEVAVQDGKLVLNPKDREAKRVVDCQGRTLCPGFIDSHSHGDAVYGTEAGSIAKLNQGITTELAGQCGSSRVPVSADPEKLRLLCGKLGQSPEELRDNLSMAAYLKKMPPLALNSGLYIGHGTLRVTVMGFADRKATSQELDYMKALLRECMEHGCMGMSSGLIYSPSCYADEEELVELCKVVAEYDGFYATHMRNEASQVVEAVAEAIRIAERAGCRLDISHHKVCGKDNWGLSFQTLNLIHQAIDRGVRVTYDVYPYTASMTALNICIPPHFFSHGPDKMRELLKNPEIRQELRAEMEHMDGRLRHCGGWGGILVVMAPETPDCVGKTVADYAASLGQDPFETYFDLVVANGHAAEAIYFSMCEEDLQRIVLDENAVICTDGLVKDLHSATHPRSFAAFVKAIRYFVKDKKLMTLEQMIYKMTGLPAERFGLTTKGRIADGMDADLLLIRPDDLQDKADYLCGSALCEGIDEIWVSGVSVYKDKQLTGAFPGKFLPRSFHK